MYIHILLSLLQCCHLGISWSQDVPTVGYPFSPGDIPADFRRRRQKIRFKENIRLKPPPLDWPSPTLGAADFLYDPPEVASLSPLQAHQAKLQEEYLREQEEWSQRRLTQPPQRVTNAASVWSSSDEDFKKLLDPNELLKLNKKLAPLMNQHSKIASYLKKGLSQTTEKTASAVTSPRSKTAKRKTTTAPVYQMRNKNEIKSSDDIKTSFEQRKTRVRKLKRRKPVQRVTGEKNIKSKKRMKKAKKFAFAIHHSSESKSKMASKADDISRLERPRGSVSKVSSDKSSSSSESAVSPEEDIYVTKNAFSKTTSATVSSQDDLTTTPKPCVKTFITPKPDVLKTTPIPNVKSFTTPKKDVLKTNLFSYVKSFTTPKTDVLNTTLLPYVKTFTTQTSDVFKTTLLTFVKPFTTTKTDDSKTTFLPQVKTFTTPKILIETSKLTTPYVTWTELKNKDTISVRKVEVREKRKRIKQEMEKVLKEEELDSSFGDEDSKWTTSEEEFYVEYDEIRKSADRKIEALKKVRTTQSPTPKFPIISVTPHEALLGILKNKIVSFVDNVLKS